MPERGDQSQAIAKTNSSTRPQISAPSAPQSEPTQTRSANAAARPIKITTMACGCFIANSPGSIAAARLERLRLDRTLTARKTEAPLAVALQMAHGTAGL